MNLTYEAWLFFLFAAANSIRKGLIFGAITLGISVSAFSVCIKDYHQVQKKTFHGLSKRELQKLEEMAQAGKPQEGWQYLGTLNDSYAALAAKVLSKDASVQNHFYRSLIATHWINSNGPLEYQNKFIGTAQQHFKQYVELLKFGSWPDSDQILLSYLTAVRDHHLPDITVFDAAWDKAGMNTIRSWQTLNHLPLNRTIFPTRACFNIDKSAARLIVSKDFLHLPFDMIFQL